MPSGPAGDTQATTLLAAAPVGGVGPVDTLPSTTTKKRSPWTWPLIALIALLAVVLIGTIIALLAQPKGASTPPTTLTTTTATHSTPPPTTPSPTPTSTTQQITEADFLGKTSAEARSMLQALGMVANVQTGSAADQRRAGRHGLLREPDRPGAERLEITVKVYGPVAPVDAAHRCGDSGTAVAVRPAALRRVTRS